MHGTDSELRVKYLLRLIGLSARIQAVYFSFEVLFLNKLTAISISKLPSSI
jgi:hypothetical protein